MSEPETTTEVWRSVWAVRILGPDDVLPALNRLDAHQRAHKANGTLMALEASQRQDPLTDSLRPMVWAVPLELDVPREVTAAEVDAAWKEWQRG